MINGVATIASSYGVSPKDSPQAQSGNFSALLEDQVDQAQPPSGPLPSTVGTIGAPVTVRLGGPGGGFLGPHIQITPWRDGPPDAQNGGAGVGAGSGDGGAETILPASTSEEAGPVDEIPPNRGALTYSNFETAVATSLTLFEGVQGQSGFTDLFP